MQIDYRIVDRNTKIQEHLDHIIVMWDEGRIDMAQAKMLYKFLAQRLVLSGHHHLFVNEFEEINNEPKEQKRTYNRFSPEDIETLKRLYARGRTAVEISGELGHNVHTVRNVIKRLQTQKILPSRNKPRASASTNNMKGN